MCNKYIYIYLLCMYIYIYIINTQYTLFVFIYPYAYQSQYHIMSHRVDLDMLLIVSMGKFIYKQHVY